jgi:protein-S-isoprenylcysteine O-methyltransferase Ste14
MYYSVSIRGESVFLWEGPLVIIKYLLLAASIFLFIAGGRNYGVSRFLGIHQIKAGHADHALSEYETFVISGIHRMIRHPWYLGGIVILWVRDLSLSTILNNIVITSYFIIGTILEERKLVREFGDQYREYQKNVSMLFPHKWLKEKIAGVPQTLVP